MSKRMFAFGCSFTEYGWPTWADIIARNEGYDYQNWGGCGYGNLAISSSVAEANARFKFNADDHIYIMWTNVTREDRWHPRFGGWNRAGNVYTSSCYPENWVEKFVDITGCFVRDLAQIHLTKALLDSTGCKYKMMSMVDIINHDQYSITESDPGSEPVFDVYAETIASIAPSVHRVVFNYDWESRTWPRECDSHYRPDSHPLPVEHLEYVEKMFPEIVISADTKQWCEQETTAFLDQWEETGKKGYELTYSRPTINRL